ncbi:MAG: hypothetical protein KAJ33_06120 [Thermoplasmata archaeon]|nr:hypothetical protein [Thermoplasmata archaeon]
MKQSVKVNISGATRALNGLSKDIEEKALPIAIARISFKGERFIKGEVPVRTGTMRRGINAAPTIKPTTIIHSTSYTHIANVRSSRPGFIQKTVSYIERIAAPETEKAIETVLKRM